MPTVDVSEGGKVKLNIPQGATYVLTLNYKDADGVAINLAGYTGRCQFRATIDATAKLYDSEDASDIVITPATGKVVLTIPTAITAAWTWRSAVYDLEIIASDSSVTRLVKGSVKIDPEVTR